MYDALTQAEDAVRKLDQGGFPIHQVSILARDLTSDREVRGYVIAGDGDVAKEGAGAGASIREPSY